MYHIWMQSKGRIDNEVSMTTLQSLSRSVTFIHQWVINIHVHPVWSSQSQPIVNIVSHVVSHTYPFSTIPCLNLIMQYLPTYQHDCHWVITEVSLGWLLLMCVCPCLQGDRIPVQLHSYHNVQVLPDLRLHLSQRIQIARVTHLDAIYGSHISTFWWLPFQFYIAQDDIEPTLSQWGSLNSRCCPWSLHQSWCGAGWRHVGHPPIAVEEHQLRLWPPQNKNPYLPPLHEPPRGEVYVSMLKVICQCGSESCLPPWGRVWYGCIQKIVELQHCIIAIILWAVCQCPSENLWNC